LKVTSTPAPPMSSFGWPTAVHCDVEAHAIAPTYPPTPTAIAVGVGVPGETGLKVTTALPSTAEHWLSAGHEMPHQLPASPEPAPANVTGVVVPGESGLNVTASTVP
jgi:hypothetical protein